MFNFASVTKPSRYLPWLISRRWKITILPKENYGDDEAPLSSSKRPVNTFATDFYSLVHRKNLTLAHFRNWKKWRAISAMRVAQSYLPERHKTLGPDLATSHFITVRGGKIKFSGNDNWMTMDDITSNNIPSLYIPGFFVEEIDASGTDLCYEGFDNLCNLHKLKKLHLRNCPFIDDWCLGRSHLFENTLEYLDITGCHLVTERGICALNRLKKLKTLVINDTPDVQNKELVSLLLQEVIPGCEVVGVDYANPTLLKRIENFL